MDKTLGIICLIVFMAVMLAIGLSNNGASSVLAFIGLMLGLVIAFLCERGHDDR